MSPPQVQTLDPPELARRLQAGDVLLVDVREPSEFATERIAGALLYPLSTFDAARLPPDGPRQLVFHCGSGKRSLSAAERRLAAGAPAAAHLGGGLMAWKAAGLPVIAIDPATGQPR
ncbi:MAG: rhodanese-like domain-containing protein [Steroidobacteraceae bacterium]|jgi:rhodanese-related sulfurtransferase